MALDLVTCMKSFIAVTEHGKFYKAAQHLYITPPVLTAQIQKLEEYTGKILFERSTRVINLTEAGKMYLPQVKQILNYIENARNSLHDIEIEPNGVLKIGVTGMFDSSPFSNIFQQFLKKYPKIQLNITSDNLPNKLAANMLDIIVSELNINNIYYNKDYLYTVERSILASPKYIEENNQPRTINELKQHNCIVYINATPTHEWVFNNKKVKISGNYVSNSFNNVTAMTLTGLGLMWVPKIIFTNEIKNGQLVEISLSNASSKRDLWVYTLPTHDLNVKLMTNYLKKSFADLTRQKTS